MNFLYIIFALVTAPIPHPNPIIHIQIRPPVTSSFFLLPITTETLINVRSGYDERFPPILNQYAPEGGRNEWIGTVTLRIEDAQRCQSEESNAAEKYRISLLLNYLEQLQLLYNIESRLTTLEEVTKSTLIGDILPEVNGIYPSSLLGGGLMNDWNENI